MCIEICVIELVCYYDALRLDWFFLLILFVLGCRAQKGRFIMAKELFVVKFSEEAEFIASAIEEFIASKVLGMDTEAADFESPYDVNPEEVFADEAEAREYFGIIQNVLIDMGYEFSVSNHNVIRIEEPIKEQYIFFEAIQVTSDKMPTWASVYDNSVKGH